VGLPEGSTEDKARAWGVRCKSTVKSEPGTSAAGGIAKKIMKLSGSLRVTGGAQGIGFSQRPQAQTKPHPNIIDMKVITTILSVLALASFVNAAEGDAKKEKPKMDPAKAFAKMDANSDGSISKEEYMATPQAKKDAAKAEKSFAGRDKDKDGKISKEEFTAAPKKKKKDA